MPKQLTKSILCPNNARYKRIERNAMKLKQKQIHRTKIVQAVQIPF